MFNLHQRRTSILSIILTFIILRLIKHCSWSNRFYFMVTVVHGHHLWTLVGDAVCPSSFGCHSWVHDFNPVLRVITHQWVSMVAPSRFIFEMPCCHKLGIQLKFTSVNFDLLWAPVGFQTSPEQQLQHEEGFQWIFKEITKWTGKKKDCSENFRN